MKHIFSFILPVLGLLVVGCSNDDIVMETSSENVGFKFVGNPVEVTFSIAALPFEEDASTRGEHPVGYEPTDKHELSALEHEKMMNTYWIFEYDASEGGDGRLVAPPFYYTGGNGYADESEEGSKWGEIVYHLNSASDNDGNEVIFYVIANADMHKDVKDWVGEPDENGEYKGFMTIEELEAQVLPTTYIHPVENLSIDNTTWPPYYYTDSGNMWREYIPKSGYTEPLKIEQAGDTVKVEVSNMYAKIMVYAKDSKNIITVNTDSGEETNFGFNVLVENIPLYCTVGPLANKETTTAFNYTSIDALQWTYFAMSKADHSQVSWEYSEETPLLILYVPENIQGEHGASLIRSENVPNSQYGTDETTKICDNPTDNPTSSTGNYQLNGASSTTDAMAVHYYSNCWTQWFGPIYPGGNNTTNFNVRRNCSYRIIFDIGEPDPDNDVIVENGKTEGYFDNVGEFEY